MSKKTEIRALQLELQSMYEYADQMGDLVESHERTRSELEAENVGLEQENITLGGVGADLRAIITGYERAEQRRKADRLQADSDAKEARYLQQIEDGLVSVELLRERFSNDFHSQGSGGITRTDLTLMLSNGSRVDEALLAALVKPEPRAFWEVPPATMEDVLRIRDIGLKLQSANGPAGERFAAGQCDCGGCYTVVN